ncbi:MAG: class F sortase [Ornithinimicrobium sp.]
MKVGPIMHRARWLVVLVVCLVAVVTAGFTILSTGQPQDVGSIEVAGTESTEDATEQTAAANSEDDGERAGAAPAVPEVNRSSARAGEVVQAEMPVRIRVADVDLDAPVDATGVAADGLMEIPDDGDRTGWYRYGSSPGGGQGSVVIAGHVDTKAGLGAMAALREVPLKTVVQVEMSDGEVREYEIVGRETVPKNDLPTETIFDREGPERLTLITCGGPWRDSESSYRDNVVVVATPLGSR